MKLRCCFHSCYLIPHVKSLLHGGTIIHCMQTMSSGSKVVGNGTKDGKKALSMSGRFEAAHGSFALPRWLMGVFSSIIQTFMLSMLDTWNALFLGGSIAVWSNEQSEHAVSSQKEPQAA